MKRQIFVVNAYIVDANGTFNMFSTNYPKKFDSHNYDDDIDKAQRRAESDFHDVCSAMCKVDSRQLQFASLTTADGFEVVPHKCYGVIADIPDPEPEEEPETESPE